MLLNNKNYTKKCLKWVFFYKFVNNCRHYFFINFITLAINIKLIYGNAYCKNKFFNKKNVKIGVLFLKLNICIYNF